jgi:hypothetical protein
MTRRVQTKESIVPKHDKPAEGQEPTQPEQEPAAPLFKWSPEAKAQFGAMMRAKYASGELKGRTWTDEEKAVMKQKMTENYRTGKTKARPWTEAEREAARVRMNIAYYGDPTGKASGKPMLIDFSAPTQEEEGQ